MKKGLKEDLIRFLARHDEWWPKVTLMESIVWRQPNGKIYMKSNVDRQLRIAQKERRIAVKQLGNTLQYKFIPTNLREIYIPFSEREYKEVLWKK